MCGSRGMGMALGLIALLGGTNTAGATDASRLDLLAGEVVSVMGVAASSPSRVGWIVLLGIPVLTMASAFLGTFLGIRGLSFGSLRDRDGWREVAYRFRYDQPMSVGKDVIQRMSGVLDDLEELGRNIRESDRTVESDRATATHDDRDNAMWSGRYANGVAASRPITFRRREEPARAPEEPEAAAPSTATEPDAASLRFVKPEARESRDRSSRYRRARQLLREGRDRETIRAMTGLKLAEVDLLRCGGSEPGGSA